MLFKKAFEDAQEKNSKVMGKKEEDKKEEEKKEETETK